MSTAHPAVELLSGAFLGAVGTGVVLGQCITYLQLISSRDESTYKLVLLVLMALLVTFTICNAYDMVNKYAGNFGNLTHTLYLGPAPITTIVINACVDLIVQSIYCNRCYILAGRDIYIAIVLGLAVAASIGSILYIAVEQALAGNYIVVHAKLGWLQGIPLIFPAICDIVITICMTYYLLKKKKLAGQSKQFISRLLILTLETNLLTTAVQGLTLILYLSTDFAFSVLTPILPQTYVLTFILWLIARQQVRMERDGTSHGSAIEIPRGAGGNACKAAKKPPNISIHVDTSRSIHIEESNPAFEIGLGSLERKGNLEFRHSSE